MTADHEDSFDRTRAALKAELEEDRRQGQHSDFRTVLLKRATENVAVRRDNRRKWRATASERARTKITNAWRRRREWSARTGQPFTAGCVTIQPGVPPQDRKKDRHGAEYWRRWRAKKGEAYRAKCRERYAMKLQSQGQTPNPNE